MASHSGKRNAAKRWNKNFNLIDKPTWFDSEPKLWTLSYQVKHRRDNDDRSGNGCQGEAQTRPLHHRLRYSWQQPTPWQLVWKHTLQRIKRSEKKRWEEKVDSDMWKERVTLPSQPSPDIMCQWLADDLIQKKNLFLGRKLWWTDCRFSSALSKRKLQQFKHYFEGHV